MVVAVVLEGQEEVEKMPSIVHGIGTRPRVVVATLSHRLELRGSLHHWDPCALRRSLEPEISEIQRYY